MYEITCATETSIVGLVVFSDGFLQLYISFFRGEQDWAAEAIIKFLILYPTRVS